MKTKAIKLASLITALLVAVALTVGYVFAWIFDKKNADLKLNGSSAGAYFDSTSGDGTAIGKEFIISNPTHMRNLAILQNNGRFEKKKYYFKIKDSVTSIDMSDIWIPPIGNDEDPFIGEFDGNGKTLAGLKVTTDKTLLGTDYPTQSGPDYEFSQAVGLFGMTGAGSDIHNLIMENPLVNVSATNTKYSSTENPVVGLAVGHVANKCSSIGVRAKDAGAALDVKVTGYSTFNSILGNLGEGVESSVTGGGHSVGSGGSGSAFGANFDMASVLYRLYKIYKGKYGIDYKKGNKNEPLANSSPELPNISTVNNDPVPAAGAMIAFTADIDQSTYEGPDAAEVISKENVGYFLGNENKFDTKKFTYLNKLTKPESDTGYIDWRTTVGASGTNVPAWLYTYDVKTGWRSGNGCYTNEGFRPLTDSEFEELPDSIKNLLSDVGDQKTFTTMRISQDGVGTGNWGQATAKQQWSYHGQISWMGKTYGLGFNSVDGYAVDGDGNYYTDQYGKLISFNAYDGGIALPNNAIWFKPKQVGKFRFVMYSQSDGDGFILNKITRTNANKENPFQVDPSENGSDVESEVILQQIIPSAVLLYYDYDVSPDEFDAGNVEFMLQQTGSNGAHFVYLDIGASAAEDTSSKVPEKQVSAVDFIYDGVKIAQEEDEDNLDTGLIVGDFIVNTSGEVWTKYDSSKTSVYFEKIKTVFKLVFLRLHNDTGKHSGKTICLEQSNPVPDKSSDVKATFATYVCPTIGGGSGTVSGSGGGGTVTPNPGPDDPVAVTSVSISGAPANMTVGGSATLSATVSPSNATDKTVTWTSSNSNIISVDSNGNIEAKAAGSATITVTAGGKSDSVTIDVTGGATQYHSGTYTLNANSTDSILTNNGATVSGSTWVLGGNAQTVNLALNVQEGKVITISVKGKRNSDKAEGINVYLGESNSGTLLGTIGLTNTEAEGSGTVQYTATADGYVYLALGRSAGGGTTLSEITVTISDGGTVTPTPTVTSVSVTPNTASVEVGKTTTLSASVTMSSGSYNGSITWSSSDTSVATVANGEVTGLKAGTATITATAGGKSDSVTITVNPAQGSGNKANLLGSLTGNVSSGKIYDGEDISVNISGSATVTSTTATAADGTNFESYLFPSGSRTYTIEASKKVTVIVYYTVMNKDTVKSDVVTATITTTDNTTKTQTSDDGTRVDGTAYKMEVSLEAGEKFVLSSAGNRLILYGVCLSE